MAYIQERTTADGKKHYRAMVRRKGHPTETQTFDRKTDARNWAAGVEADMRVGRHTDTRESRKHTLADALDRYEEHVLPKKRPGTAYGQKIQLTWFREEIGHVHLCNVTPSILVECRDKLAEEKKGEEVIRRGPATVRRYLAALGHVFTIAVKEWGWMEDSPMRKVTKPVEPAGRLRSLTDTERDTLLKECAASRCESLHDIVLILLCTGARRSEIQRLRWPEVDFTRNTITLEPERSKNKQRRIIPLAGPALEILKSRNRIRRIDTDYVFAREPNHGHAPQPVDIQSAWDWAVKRAKLENFRIHDLRHDAASRLAMTGATLYEIATVLGHRSLSMVQRYSHLSDGHVGNVVERMVAQTMTQKAQPTEEAAS